MLSPKTLREGVDAEDVESCGDLDKCDCSVDHPFFQQALDQVTSDLSNTMFEWAPNGSERESYPLFVTFLNTCIDKCHSALDSQPGAPSRDERWYSNLRFVVYDKQMADGVEGSHPLKLDCAGGRGLQDGVAKLCWNTSNHEGIPQLDLPAEIKSNWRQLLKQAAVYGCCLFSASPTRSWSLVLGFNQKSRSLRFLIFHRGGCTASKDINLDDQEGRKDAYRLILTILLWTEPYHAGFSSFSTDKEFAVPSDDMGKKHVTLKVVKTLYHTIAIRSRATLVALVSSTNASEEPEVSPQLVPSARAERKSARLQAKPATMQPTEQSAAGSAGVSRPSQRGRKPESSATNRKGINVVGTSTSKVSDAAEQTGGHSHCSERGDEQSSAAMADEPVVSDLPWIIPGNVRLSLKYTQPLRISTGLLPTGIQAALLKTLILKLYWPDDKDDVEGELMKATCGAFGTPSHIYSYGPMDPSGLLVSNNIFLPADNPESIGNAWWKVFSHDVRDCPEHPNYRAAHIVLLGAVGLSLLSATSSWALCEAIVHALLGMFNFRPSQSLKLHS
ncbi:hypothetical protein Moror_2345 [Moniliophthora roreri MCA 2997]|uniref:Fungal-type protein kinase domain-containing protein n=1 Tax=Moniliophthora roreri (strain MCA 2997) TaxID=1381753 RepID=V2WGA1_MONRO|nr:hypothetical protein Moror_2345 [Moniliophthora roreri MCA 2997]